MHSFCHGMTERSIAGVILILCLPMSVYHGTTERSKASVIPIFHLLRTVSCTHSIME